MPSGYEVSGLPAALNLQAKELKREGERSGYRTYWASLRYAHLDAIAFLFSGYDQVFFIARDGEYLYKMAEAFLDHHDLHRNHLINVSRLSMNDSNLLGYLESIGLRENLRKGYKTVIVDTGFQGSVAEKIINILPKIEVANLRSHLICSRVENHPSIRSFLFHLTGQDANPWYLESGLRPYEGLPHFTGRSESYLTLGGAIHPISKAVSTSDSAGGDLESNVDRLQTIEILRDILFFSQQVEARKYYKSRLAFWKHLFSFYKARRRTDLVDELNRLVAREDSTGFEKSQVRDMIEYTEFAGVTSMTIFPEDVNLGPNSPRDLKKELKKRYPLESHLLFGNGAIEKAVSLGKWADLHVFVGFFDKVPAVFAKAVLHAKKDLAEKIGELNPSDRVIKFYDGWIAHDPKILSTIAAHAFVHPNSEILKPLLFELIDSKDSGVHIQIAMNVFSQPHTISWEGEFNYFKSVADPYSLELADKYRAKVKSCRSLLD